MLSGAPLGQSLQKRPAVQRGYGSPALITEHATHESMSPQAGIIHSQGSAQDFVRYLCGDP
jgi:hypothetical protein